jgi:hypothetical protein
MNDKKMTREFQDISYEIESKGWAPLRIDQEQLRCRGCGAAISPGWDKCATCGLKLPPSNVERLNDELANLIVVKGDTAGDVFRLKFEVHVIGRGEEADLVVRDPEISRMHARFKRHENYYILEDLGSANGTWINGARVEGRRLLMPGDRLRLGQTELIVRYSHE